MSRDIVFDEEAVSRLLRGANRMVDTVRSTFGPRGLHVALQIASGPPKISNLGSEVALEIELIDPIENMGVRLLREAASQTMADVGDGTISTLLLTQSILVQAMKILAAGASSHALVQEIQKATGRIIEELNSLGEPLTAELARSIAINAAQDPEIGALVGEAMGDADSAAVVHIEADSAYPPLSCSVTHGMRLDWGFADRSFSPGDGEVTLHDTRILLTTGVLRSAAPLVPIMEQAKRGKKSLLIIARDIKDEALATCVVNFMRETLRVLCIRAPFTEEGRNAVEDTALFTGTEVIVDEAGVNLSELKLDRLGHARKVIVSSTSTTILEGKGGAEAMRVAIDKTMERLRNTRSSTELALLEARVARLKCRATVIKVGGATDLELANRRAKAERALYAVRAAALDGVVPGGGVSLLRAGDAMRLFDQDSVLDPGTRVMWLACEVLVRQLAVNSGYDPGAVLSRIRQSRNLGFGFNVNSNRFEDLMSAGIVDPLRVLVAAFRSAASVAATVVTARAAIFEKTIRVTTDLEKKYANKGGYTVPRSLAWPPYSEDYDVRGFANLLPDLRDDSERAGNARIWEIEAGIERVPEETTGAPAPRLKEDLEFTVSVSSIRASIQPDSAQVIILRSREDRVSKVFRLSFAEAGTRTVLVEFYFRRVWLGQIAMEVENEQPRISAAAVEQAQ